MITNVTNKFWRLVMAGLADVDGFKIFVQVCMLPRSWPPDTGQKIKSLSIA